MSESTRLYKRNLKDSLVAILEKGKFSAGEVLPLLLEFSAREADKEIDDSLISNLIEMHSKASNKLVDSERKYRSLIAAMSEGVVMQNSLGAIVTMNKAAENILGLDKEQMAGRRSIDPRWRAIHEDGSDYPGETHPAMLVLKEGKPIYNAIMGVHKPNGDLTWISINSQPLFEENEKTPYAAVTTFSDITESKLARERLETISVTDHLTQIYNRVKFTSVLESETERARRYALELSLIMFDIDHFKRVNDTHGHDKGDIVLVETAKRVKKEIRTTDIFARWGGEEFMLLLPNTDEDSAYLLAERIRKAICLSPITDKISISSSFGVTYYKQSDNADEFVKRADVALYEAKESGRNRVVCSE